MARRWSDFAIVFTGAAFLAVVGVVTSGSRQGAMGDELLRWLLLGILAVTLTGSVAWLLRRPTEAIVARTTFRRTVVVAYSAGIGALFGITVVLLQQLLGIVTDEPPAAAIIVSTLYTPLYALGIWLIRASFDAYTRARNDVIDTMIALEATRLQQSLLIDELRSHVRNDIAAQLTRTKELIDNQLRNIDEPEEPAAWVATAAALREAAQVHVRGASRELWHTVEHTYPRANVFTLLREVVSQQPLRPTMVVAAYAVAASADTIRARGVVDGLFDIGVVSAGIWLVMAGANAAMRRLPRAHTTIFIGTVAFFQILNLITRFGEAAATDTRPNAVTLLLETVSSVFLIVGASAVFSLRAEHEQRVAHIAGDVDRARIAQIARARAVAGVARESARLLHGQVQTKLVGCAIAIDMAPDSGDLPAMEKALAHARQILADPLPAVAPGPVDLWGDLDRVSALWNGLCDVDVLLAPDVEPLPAPTIARIGSIVEEAVTNAVRHAGANWVEVRVERAEPPRLRVAVTDNGTGPQAGVAGLGSSLIDDATLGMWHLERRDDATGARLVAYVDEHAIGG